MNDRTVYVTRRSQKYHYSKNCAGDSVPMSLTEAFSGHNPCRNCCDIDDRGVPQ